MTIKVNHLTFITDFFFMDIEDDQQVPIILGRSFIRIAHVTIDVRKGVYTLRESKKQIFFYIQGIEDFPNVSAHQQHHHTTP